MGLRGHTMAKLSVRGDKLSVTIPDDVREEIAAHNGDEIDVRTEDGRIVLTPKEEVVERHPEIDVAIAEGLADIAAGRVSPAFSSVKEWKAWLKTPEGKKFGKK